MARKKKRGLYQRPTGIGVQRIDAGEQWGRTVRYLSPLPIINNDPDTQYRRCGICKVQGAREYARYIARIPGRNNWTLLCERHFKEYGCKLGHEHGQRIIINPKWADQMTPEEKKKLAQALAIKARETEARAPKPKTHYPKA